MFKRSRWMHWKAPSWMMHWKATSWIGWNKRIVMVGGKTPWCATFNEETHS